MRITIQKLGITIEDEEPCGGAKSAPIKGSSPASAPASIPACSLGYAVYVYRGTRQLQRVGGATCLAPHTGYSAYNSAGSYVSITSAFSSQLANLYDGNGPIKELRFAVCCPPPASVGLARTDEAPRKSAGKPKK